MPCYDSRNEPDYVRREAREDFRHNSDVAEMLCWILTNYGDSGIELTPDIKQWWEEHKSRDAAK
jgi:hypothetical protein